MRDNSPSLPMLKFLEVVLKDVAPVAHPEHKLFFLQLLEALCAYMPNCIYEEIFTVFDLLVDLSRDVFSAKTVRICIHAFADKFTVRSKAYKNSIGLLYEIIFREAVPAPGRGSHKASSKSSALAAHALFFTAVDTCLFSNEDARTAAESSTPGAAEDLRRSSTGPMFEYQEQMNRHDNFVELLQFLCDML